MWLIFTKLNEIWNNYPIAFIVLLVGWFCCIISFISKYFPAKCRLDKRFWFWIKVSKTMCSIKVSFIYKDNIELKNIEKKLIEFSKSHSITDFNTSNGKICFNSNDTGSSYKIDLIKDEETIVAIHSFNGFYVGAFGIIRNLDENLDELKSIVDFLSSDKKSIETIIIEMSIYPKLKFLKSKLKADFSKNNFSCSYNSKQICLTNKGFSKIKQNLSSIFYEWMVNFV